MHGFGFELYAPTKIFFGARAEAFAREVARTAGKVLLCTGTNAARLSGALEEVTQALEKEGVAAVLFEGVEPNPRTSTVSRAVRLARKEGAEAVIGIGGGSAIDCAKAVAVGALYAGDVWDLVIKKDRAERALPVFAVPTSAATGSEMNAIAVISNWETHEKYGYHSELIRPRAALLDPVYTYTLPALQTAAGAADILSHIFDKYYFTLRPTLEMTKASMEAVMRAVVKFAPVAMREAQNFEARANLQWAAAWALNGFFSPESGPACCHAMEHELSARYDITHGVGLAVLMPRWLTYCMGGERSAPIARMGREVFGTSGEGDEGAAEAIAALEKFLYSTLGLPQTLSSLGVGEEELGRMAENAARGGGLNGFRHLGPADVLKIYRASL